MQYEVVVPIPVRSIWDTFHDAERLAQCVPGLLLDEPARTGAEGVELTGRWQLRVGAETVTYRGTLRLADAVEPLALVASVAGTESGAGDAAGRIGAEFTVRLYDLVADEQDGPSETRIVFADTPGHTDADVAGDPSEAGDRTGSHPTRPDAAFARAADLFAAALADELAPVPAADTPFEAVEPIADPFASERERMRRAQPPAPRPAAVDAEPDLWSEAGHGTGRAARRAIRVLVPALGALLVWRLVHVRRRRGA
ncbi:CoxG family protein [Embleya scabrispora]|uniref:CoxG family protein n=1 Tax=Embleya scabrispora TaxID=159449 RepID=UPI000381FC7F|nr:hypothetical protein [Embleya scabrispora]MYS79572.1 hypothetical protein [Streptomyces sp. SID5474]